MLLRLLLLGGAIYLIWRLLRKRLPVRPAHDPGSDRQARSAVRSPHEVLGVEPDASADSIRLAYQHKVSQYHPDKVAGLGPELRALAEERTKELNAAYQLLRRR